jgi:uncharacterized protein
MLRTLPRDRSSLLRLLAAIPLVVAASGHARAQTDPYGTETIVSGTVTETRADGLARCLRDVLVKVSGDPRLLDDPRIDALEGKPADLVEDFAYIDRMSDLPHHDEQGSRDRPFTLIVHFSPPKIDAVLARLGEGPWRGERPPLLIRVTVRDRTGASFAMTADADADERLREALLAAADRYGMRVVLPPAGQPASLPAGVPLTGTLVWSDADFGWNGDWHISWDGNDYRWANRGVSFDGAFRNAVLGAMAVLAGHSDALGISTTRSP